MKTSMIKFWQKVLLIVADVVIVFFSAMLTYYGTVVDASLMNLHVTLWILANILMVFIIYLPIGLYDIIFSAVGLTEMLKLGLSAILIAVVNLCYSAVPNTIIDLQASVMLAAMIFCGGVLVRSVKRILVFFKRTLTRAQDGTRVMVIGGGQAGTMLFKEMQTSDKIEYAPVCIIDDDIEKIDKKIQGVPVVGDTYSIKKNAERYKVQEIFVCMPSVSKKKLSEIVERCQECGCPVKTLPGMYQLATGQVAVSSLRQVDVQDLLGRDSANVNLDEIMGYIEEKVVLVTGGGGSIGSELCRQIASHNPKTLIVLDIYENNAYDIEQELKRAYPNLKLLTLIASVRDERKMEDVFKKYRPQIVFHAAAHKHVPLMETSPNEAVKNNVFGTLNVARFADKYKVKTFVQISTDKAVNPTNIMGATKRICEMLIQAIGRQSKHTNFVAVRFGNVLGSNGSVIPLFKKQIAEGGPVTVTHKDIIRYFMTIPEAVSLVLQAGAYAKGGQIFVLDMGEPVRIYDLAYNLIKLSGYEPNVDIDIVCTGLRPGEKLYEERLMKEEGLQKTANGLISIAKPLQFDEESFWNTLEELKAQAYAETEDMKKSVKKLVPTYTIDERDSIAEAIGE